MKLCRASSAFADRNYGPDGQVGTDEEGDVSASDDDETGNGEIRSGRQRAAWSWDDRRAARRQGRGREVARLDDGVSRRWRPAVFGTAGDLRQRRSQSSALAARSTSIGCHRDTSFGGRCKIIFASYLPRPSSPPESNYCPANGSWLSSIASSRSAYLPTVPTLPTLKLAMPMH
jgi:hypothetical protein